MDLDCFWSTALTATFSSSETPPPNAAQQVSLGMFLTENFYEFKKVVKFLNFNEFYTKNIELLIYQADRA